MEDQPSGIYGIKSETVVDILNRIEGAIAESNCNKSEILIGLATFLSMIAVQMEIELQMGGKADSDLFLDDLLKGLFVYIEDLVTKGVKYNKVEHVWMN